MVNRQSNKGLKYIGNIGLIISIFIFVSGLVSQNSLGLLLSVSVIWTSLVIYNFDRRRFALFSFYITFFAFLLGTAIVGYFDETVSLRFSNEEALLHTYKCLYIALLSAHVGSCFSGKLKFRIGNRPVIKETPQIENYKDNSNIQMASKYVFLFCSLFSIALALEKMAFTIITGSYTSSYINLASSLPSFFQKIDGMTSYAFFIYLACLPDPQRSKLVFADQILISLLLLIHGQRTPIVMTALTIVLYIVLYENEIGEPFKYIRKRTYVLALILFPFLLTFFDFFMAFRDGRTYTFVGLWNSVEHIVASLGGSVNVIGYGYIHDGSFPANKIYSLGGIIDFITKNVFSRLVFGTKVYGGNNALNALNGNSFSHAITYIVRPSSYLTGYGMGSSYIAEAFHDFGYIGVIIFSFVYGVFLQKVSSLKKGKTIRNAVIIMATYFIFVAPRSNADSFIAEFFNFSFLLTAAIVYFLSRSIKTNRR